MPRHVLLFMPTQAQAALDEKLAVVIELARDRYLGRGSETDETNAKGDGVALQPEIGPLKMARTPVPNIG